MRYQITVNVLGVSHETTIEATERGPNEIRTAIENLDESGVRPAWNMRLADHVGPGIP